MFGVVRTSRRAMDMCARAASASSAFTGEFAVVYPASGSAAMRSSAS